MLYTATIFALAFLICVGSVLIYLHAEKNTYSEILEKAQIMQLEVSRVKRELEKTNQRIDEWRTVYMKQQSEIDQSQEHCARIREQQQILKRRQNSLREKMVAQKVEVIFSDEPKQTIAKPPMKIINKIKKQLNDLN